MLKNLCSKNKRLIKHLTLLNNAAQKLTVSELAVKSKCSQKTVYSDLDYLNYIYEGLFHIIIDKPYIMMNKVGSGCLNKIIKDIVRNDMNFQVILSFYTDAMETIEHYAVKHDISVQSVHNIRNKANQFLKQYQAKIVSKNNLYYIKSQDEILLQSLFAHFINFNDSKPSEDFITFLEYFNSQDFRRSKLKTHTNLDEALLDRDINAVIKSSYIRIKGFNPSWSYQEIANEIFIILEAFPKLSKSIAPYALEFIKQTFIVLDAQQIEKISGDKKEKFTALVYYAYIISYILRDDSYTNQFRISEFAKDYKLQNPTYYHYVETTIQNQNLPIEMDKKNLINTLLYFTFIYFDDVSYNQTVNILVSSELSLKHARSLAIQIERHFPMHRCFITVNSYALNEIMTHYPQVCFGFIVSTSQVHKSIDLPVIYVSDFLSSTDYKHIYEQLYNKKDIK